MGFDEYYHYFSGYMKRKNDNSRFMAYLTAWQINIMIMIWTSDDNKKVFEVDDIMGIKSETIEKTADTIINKIRKNEQELDRIFNSPAIGGTALDMELDKGH